MSIIKEDRTWVHFNPNCPKCLLCNKTTKRMGNHKYPYWECDEHGRISTTVLVDHLVSQSDPRLLKEYQIQIEELQRRLANLEEESDILKTDLESRDLEETILV